MFSILLTMKRIPWRCMPAYCDVHSKLILRATSYLAIKCMLRFEEMHLVNLPLEPLVSFY